MEHLKWIGLVLLLTIIEYSKTTELTFELPDSARECFHEEIGKNTSATLEFQVSLEHDLIFTLNNLLYG